MRFYWLLIGTLAVWRITHLLAAEDGPWEILARLRQRLGSGFWGKLMDCFYCLSVWVALPAAGWLGRSWPERILLWPALSGASVLLERATNPAFRAGRAVYAEDEEQPNALLRTEKNTGSDARAEEPGGASG
jgi:hypothetical protein